MSIKDTAYAFADACDCGKGWDVCKQWCHDGATFTVQADALAEITSLEGYVGWAQSLLTPMPDARYELKSLAVDEERGKAIVVSVFHGTHTVDAGSPPTGKAAATDYVYVLDFEGDKIKHMTKIWNDGHALKQLGWA